MNNPIMSEASVAKRDDLSRRTCFFSSRITALIAGVLAAISPGNALAEGFRNSPSGAFNLGRAGGRIAHVDDSSAAAQNPANLVDLSTPEAMVTPSFIYYQADYSSTALGEAKTTDPWKILPNFFAAYPIKDGQYALGLGVTVPYGISVEWEKSGAFANPSALKYQAPFFTELKTINAAPSFAAKLGEHFQAGAGLDLMWSELTFKQTYPWLSFPGSTLLTPDGTARIKGDNFGVGANLGVTWKPHPKHRLAVTYRSPVSVSYEGSFTIDNITPAAAAAGVTPRSDFSTQITFPSIVAAGYGIALTDTIRIEADVEWIQFSRFDSLDLTVGNNYVLLPSTSIREDWKDTFTAGIGGDWKFHPNWVVRAGYQFYQSPVPDHTFSTTIPDANQNVLTFGLGFHKGHHAVEAAYGLDFYDTRNISNAQNPVFNGKYELNVHLFSFAYTYRF